MDNILNAALDGWHEWEIDDPEMLEQSDWLRNSRQYVKEFFEKSVQRGAYSTSSSLHKRSWLVTNQGNALDALTPQAAALYFTTPLRICVENEFTDRLFVETVLFFLASQELKDFLSQFEQGQKKPVEYLHGGGIDELCKLIERRVDESAAQGIRFRAVVITDSDTRFPSDDGDMQKKPLKLERFCQENNIPCVILRKRTIENYIPDEVLRGWADGLTYQKIKGFVNAVGRLNYEQRNHMRMKKAFPERLQTTEEKFLYSSVPSQDKEALSEKDLAPDQSRRDLIYLLDTHKQYLTADSLRRRDGQEELDRLVTLIAEEL
ncbi:MAG: hypothetical protein WGN25_15195 [Candidatus Electrothrix sp. GW3-4]|uniref:hypothetical protein n=1 Tax=Candidatus Electrothrix sp. GW3-4 TaxID=3126740 RepID=UPI0030CB1A3B